MDDKDSWERKISDMELIKIIREEIGYNRTLTHIGFLLQELGVWKGHIFTFGNYPLSLQSDGLMEMLHEASYSPFIKGEHKRFKTEDYPLIDEIESLVRNRKYWYDIFAYLLFCNKYGYPSKLKDKKYQVKVVKVKHKNARIRDINKAWKILVKHGLITVGREQ